MENMDEMELLRQQMNMLKDKLAKQDIVNSKLLVESMKNKTRWINKLVYAEIVAVVLIMPVLYAFARSFNCSNFSSCTFLVVLALSVVSDYIINVRGFNNIDYHSNSLLDAATQLIRMKKLRLINEICSCVVALLVIAWMIIEAMQSELAVSPIIKASAYGALGGGIIGGLIGMWLFLKMQRSNDEVIKQINEFVNEQ